MTATQALMGGILKILNVSEILPVVLVDRLSLSVAVTSIHIVNDDEVTIENYFPEVGNIP